MSADNPVIVDSSSDEELIELMEEASRTPEEFMELYNINQYNLDTVYAHGSALASELNAVQHLLGNVNILNELENLRNFIDDDLDSNMYLTGWNLGVMQQKSNEMLIMQNEIFNQLHTRIDLTGQSLLFTEQPKKSLQTRFDDFRQKHKILTDLYNQTPLSYYLEEKSNLFLKLFCESTLDIIIQKRVNLQFNTTNDWDGTRTFFPSDEDSDEDMHRSLRF